MKKRSLTPYLFIAPALAMLILFQFYPIVSALRISLHDWSGLGPMKFIALQNYVRVFKDAQFWHSIKLTFIWAIMSTFILTFTGLFLAIMVEFNARSRWLAGLSRTILFLPQMMSGVSVALLWMLIYNPMLGLVNGVLVGMGVVDPMNPLNILGNPRLALYGAFVPAIWQVSGFGMVVFSAAMTNIPQELLEAAAVDGASRGKQFFRIILPLLTPTIFTLGTLHMIGAFKAFDMVYTMTSGGPGGATMITALYNFITAFKNHFFGYASSISTVLFILVLLLTLGVNKLGKKVADHFGF
jgi:ABC-type sugar transport system permease subunit